MDRNFIILANLTSDTVSLPKGTIVATSIDYKNDENELFELTEFDDNAVNSKASYFKMITPKNTVNAKTQNKMHHKPSQAVVIDRDRKIVAFENVKPKKQNRLKRFYDVVDDVDSVESSFKAKEIINSIDIYSNLTVDQIEKVKELLRRKIQAFAKKDQAPNKATNLTHKIDTGAAKPIHQPKYSDTGTPSC
jgi:hypothetical protein